jgi:quinol monooxygenase YgiN
MSDDLLVVIAEGKAKPGKEDDLRRQLQALLAPTRAEQGCVQYDMHESVDDPGRFVFFERWTTREALDEHLQMPHMTEFFGHVEGLVDGGINIRFFRKTG